MAETNAAWLITGCSAGLGYELAKAVLGIEAATKKLSAALAEIEIWREIGLLTDFPAAS